MSMSIVYIRSVLNSEQKNIYVFYTFTNTPNDQREREKLYLIWACYNLHVLSNFDLIGRSFLRSKRNISYSKLIPLFTPHVHPLFLTHTTLKVRPSHLPAAWFESVVHCFSPVELSEIAVIGSETLIWP